MTKASKQALEQAMEFGWLPSEGTHTEKLKAIGADFSRGDWDTKLVYDLYHERGLVETNAIIDAMTGMRLGAHGFGPNKERTQWLNGLVFGLFLAENKYI